MNCENCKKKKAIIHYTEVVDGQIKKINLCEDCAKAKGIGFHPPFSIGDLLGGLTNQIDEKPTGKTALSCPECGMTLAIFRKTGRLGCGNCYKVFYKSLIPILNSIHKSTKHLGKIPSRAKKAMGTVTKIRDLELRLQDAVKKEEFEQAAKIRDKIRNLEKKDKSR